MNHRMWAHPATQANAELLRSRGVELIGPEDGELAEGESGVGRMAEPEAIFARCEELLARAATRSIRSPGGTSSSARAGRASRSTRCASSATARPGVWASRSRPRRGGAGRDVTLLAANLSVPAPVGVDVVQTPTAADLEREALARGASADVVVMAAAVADYRPAEAHEGKRPKSGEPLGARRSSRPTDVLRDARASGARTARCSSASRPSTARPGIERARAKLARQARRPRRLQRRLAGRTSASTPPTTRSTLIEADGERRVAACAARSRIAAAILDEVARLLESQWTQRVGPGLEAAGVGGDDRARRGQPRAGRPRARRDAPPLRALPRRRGAPDHRGLPGGREDDAREGARALGRLPLLAAPVHARPAADRRHRRQRLQPARERVRVPARARSSRTSCSSTRSTARRRRRRPRCSSACRRTRSPSTASATRWSGRS